MIFYAAICPTALTAEEELVSYFLNKFSNALRASSTRIVLDEVSFSTITRIEKDGQVFLTSFRGTRSTICCAHSKRLAGSK